MVAHYTAKHICDFLLRQPHSAEKPEEPEGEKPPAEVHNSEQPIAEMTAAEAMLMKDNEPQEHKIKEVRCEDAGKQALLPLFAGKEGYWSAMWPCTYCKQNLFRWHPREGRQVALFL